jgi:enamine deaminase RidA (YjgF/YER057c/UK114 family)
MGKVEKRIAELGLELPPAPTPLAAYAPFAKSNKLVFVSGQLPRKDGKIICTGRVGAEVSLEQGKEAARLCALNAVSVLKAAAGNLDKVRKILRLTCWVASAEDFYDHPKVADGASDLMVGIFGEAGKHARMSTGVNVLPGNAAVAIDLIAELR